MNKYYTGCGSRKVPNKIVELILEISKKLSDQGYILRSGAAEGCDKAFERNAATKQIFNPYSFKEDNYIDRASFRECWQFVLQFHPAPFSLKSEFVKRLMARNTMQVLGPDLKTPSDFVVCWTPDGATSVTTQKTGGTGQAIRIACAYDIPVYNLADLDSLNKLDTFISK